MVDLQLQPRGPAMNIERDTLKAMERERFGRQVRALRTKCGRSQADVAQDAGMSRVTLSKVENGVHDLATSFVRPLAAALGVAPSQLFEQQEP